MRGMATATATSMTPMTATATEVRAEERRVRRKASLDEMRRIYACMHMQQQQQQQHLIARPRKEKKRKEKETATAMSAITSPTPPVPSLQPSPAQPSRLASSNRYPGQDKARRNATRHSETTYLLTYPLTRTSQHAPSISATKSPPHIFMSICVVGVNIQPN
jgi:hypothetical protein